MFGTALIDRDLAFVLERQPWQIKVPVKADRDRINTVRANDSLQLLVIIANLERMRSKVVRTHGIIRVVASLEYERDNIFMCAKK